jgi:hypothetical protein
MNINELTRPKIGKRVTNTAFDYFRQRHPYNKSLSSKLPNSLSTNDIEARMNAIADVDDTLTSNLEKMGWEKIGWGVFSSIYGNPKKSFVLKVNKREDKGYERYATIIKKNPNKFFPKISDMKVMKIGKNNYCVYLIEKLEEIPLARAQRYEKIFDTAMASQFRAANTPDIESLVLYFNGKIPLIFKQNPDLVLALNIIANDQGSKYMDLHQNNMMQRANGTLVITDPYS